MSYFTEDLIESIKNRSLAPIAQSTFDDEKLLALANEELQLSLTADLVKVREEFFMTTEETSIIADVANYGIPSRAIGDSVKEVIYIPSGQTKGKPLSRADSSKDQDYDGSGQDLSQFYIEGDEIIVLPTPSVSTGSLKFRFPATPNNLALTTTCAKITDSSLTDATATFDVNTDLTASLAVGDYVDFLSTRSPFKLWFYRVPITQITSTQIDVDLSEVINAAGTIQPQINDYICPSGTANIPQIPVAFHPVLSQMVVVRLMESLGDINKKNVAEQTLARMRADAGILIKNRVENSLKKVSGRNQLRRYFR